MALYEYLCADHGPFDRHWPLGTAPAEAECPHCGGAARRVFSAPMLRTGRRSEWTAALDHAEKSRHEPDVVSAPPSLARSPRPATPLNPALFTLPRP
ncbi:MAG: zinc ribbon domain-containing protein [Rubrivivax sp.]